MSQARSFGAGPAHGAKAGAGAADREGDLARRLAAITRQVDPPAEALAVMRLSLFDWAACTIAGSAERVARIMRAQAEAEGGAAQASLVGAPALRVPARAAALVAGTASHALDYDDTHLGPVLHPSVTVIPAAFAVAERQGVDGAAMLRAALIGAELAVRLGLWAGPGLSARGFHPTGTCGAFGATIAAGLLAGLEGEELAHALGIAATRAAGLQAVFGTMGKPLNAGMAAATGVEAADLAEAGLRCDPAALDGPHGFGPAHGGAGDAAALITFGAQWEMVDVAHKFHACCHGLHAALEALAEVGGAGGLGPDTVDRVTIRTHPRWLAVCDKQAPRTGLEAKFSYRLTAAMVLAGRDTAAPATFTDTACHDPVLIALRDRIDVIGDRTLAETEAVVDVTAQGGSVLRRQHDLAAPQDLATRSTRLHAKAVTLLGKGTAAALAEATLGPAPDLPAIGALLRAAPV